MNVNQQYKHDYLYLVWRSQADHTNRIVGKLYKEDIYIFEYEPSYLETVKAGKAELLYAFPEANKKYKSKDMFPSFASRLPDRKRKDIESILEKYNLSKFDEYELLRRGGGRLPIDTFEFVDPIFPTDKTVQRDFFVMGGRHYLNCAQNNCQGLEEIDVGDCLELRREPENMIDINAVQVYFEDELIGYVPNYYSEAVSTRLKMEMSYTCTVIETNGEGNCNKCIKVRLIMPKTEDLT